jgi:hypothetical protein
VLWLARPPYLRWAVAVLLVMLAAWSEFSPPPTTTLTFLAVDVAAGTPLDESLVVRRRIPATDINTVDPVGVAAVDLKAGDPLLDHMVTEVVVPAGWNVIEAPVPDHAVPGAPATGVILADGSAPIEFPALVVGSSGSDPFDGTDGSLAVSPEWTAAAAAAAAEGRLVIGVRSGDG